MKKMFIALWLLNSFLLSAKEEYNSSPESQKHSIHVYLCSRLTEAAKQWNNEITKELNADFYFFRPQDLDLSNVLANQVDWVAYQADLEGMLKSDLLLVLPAYGRDCAWEIGWFCGKEKPAIAYAEIEGDWLRDGMVKGGLTAIITNNENLYKKLLEDPSTTEKSYFISVRRDLGKTIKEIYHQTQNNYLNLK